MIFRRLFITLVFGIWAQIAIAAPASYDIDRKNSSVAFIYKFQGNEITGSFPDFSAVLKLDFDRPTGSRVSVKLKTATAKGGFVFATQTMRGPEILDASQFPEIRFSSTNLQANGRKAKIKGNITVKGITRPISLTAQIFRQSGTKQGQLDNLVIKISGQINRKNFGITGYQNLVGDILKIAVTAEINRRR